jgi:O-antigen ligase
LINKIRKFYLTIVFLVSIDILIQYFYGIDILGFRADIVNGFATPIQNWSEIENIERYTGPFGYEKRAGTFILVFGLISIFLNEFNKKKTFNFFSIFSLIFFFVIIIITGDRSPLITYIIVLFLILIFEKNKKFFLFIIFSLLTVFIIFIIFSSKANFRYIKNLDNFRNYEVNQSLFRKIFHNNPWAAHNLNAMEIFKSSPFFGKGIKSFRVECKKHEDIDSSYANFSCSTHPHNILFEIISEVGLVGLTILVSILFFLIKKFSSSSSLSSRSYIFYLFIGLILPIKPSGALFSSWFGSLIWLSVAFAFLYNKNFNK